MDHGSEATRISIRYTITDVGDGAGTPSDKKPARKPTPEYMAWSAMLHRCSNPNSPFWKDYGGRGISVCAEWRDYERFLKDVGKKPSPHHSLDRIDNNGDYSPGNVRWATWKQQIRNRRNTKFITVDGVTRSLPEWCEIRGLSLGTAWARVSRGWPDQEVIAPRRKAWTRKTPADQAGPSAPDGDNDQERDVPSEP